MLYSSIMSEERLSEERLIRCTRYVRRGDTKFFFAVDDGLSNKHRQIDLAENLSQNRMSLTYFTYYYY